MLRKKIIFTIIMLVIITHFAYSQNVNETVTAYKLENEIIIDGILNESIYKNKSVTNFIQNEPNEGKEASEKTDV